MFAYDFMQNALIAGLLVSILCPLVGIFIVLKRYSMIGDTLSHASFAGIAIGLVTGFNPLLTSFAFTGLCGLFIEILRNYYKKYAELVMSITLTLSIGVAIILISSGKASANVNSILFGSILTVNKADLKTIAILSVICFLVIGALFNKLLYITFDEEGAKAIGIKVKLINYIFILLVSATIALSIKIMGLLVISSMIVVPVATALQLKKGFKVTLIASIIFGMLDVVGGLILSYYVNSAPGGTIALSSVFLLCITLIVCRFKNTSS